MKLYTFLNEEGEILVAVMAEKYEDAIEQAMALKVGVEWNTDFYSEELGRDENGKLFIGTKRK